MDKKPVIVRVNQHQRTELNASVTMYMYNLRFIYGEVGQPTLTIKEHGVAAGEEITVDYGPWYAYNQHGFDRYAPSSGAGDDDDDDHSSGDTSPATDAGTVSVAAATEPLEVQTRRLLNS
eukprot:COSAG01_NODE_1264_length_10990_cov_35.511615_2_plen_120_part_00